MRIKFWLIAENSQELPPSLSRAARLRNVQFESCRPASLAEVASAPGDLIVISGVMFQGLPPSERIKLGQQVAAGATCYVAGRWSANRLCAFAPFAPGAFEFALDAQAPAYSFTSHDLVPGVLRGEQARGRFSFGVTQVSSEMVQPLMVAPAGTGSRSVIFAADHGAGRFIFDLTAAAPSITDSGNEDPSCTVRLLENPASRISAIGPLIAVDVVAGHDPNQTVACDIVMDDRPINWDYFNVRALRTFLQYLKDRSSRVHIDFAWTPDQTRASTHYVQTLKQFNAGFVWHGLLRHVDHRSLSDPERDFAEGCRLMKDISGRYDVNLQPVMVFPYEKETERCIDLIRRRGFVANARTPDHGDPAEFELSGPENFVTLTRDSIETLTRDRMLARAAAGLPIIVAAHPRNAGLRRLAAIRRESEVLTAFDPLLDFATEKGLRPQSLQEIARDWLEKRGNINATTDFDTEVGLARAG